MTVGQSVTVDVSPFFRDPDGGSLTYTAESSAPAVLSVSIAGSDLTLEAVAAGTATVTVTATDPDNLSATQSAEVTVAEPNLAPEAVGAIPAQAMAAGQSATVDVSPFFRDPDGDALTYAAESSAPAVLSVSIAGSDLTLEAVAGGTATVTVTATDPDGLSATQSAEVTVTENRAPEAVGAIPAQALTAGQSATVDVSPFFRDPDGDALTYAAESSAPAVLSVSIAGSGLTLEAVAAGTATVTVTATDPDGLSATQSAEVSVGQGNRAPEAVGAVPVLTTTVGQSIAVDVARFFRDPDGDALTYAAESSAPAVLSASIAGSGLTLDAVAVGTATVTVTATDPGGLSATQSAEVTVHDSNRPPVAVGAIPAQALAAGQSATVDVSPFFRDPDGDALAYGAESSAPAVLSVSVAGSDLTLEAVEAGTATVTVTATDPDGLSATQSAEVSVRSESGGGFRDDFDSPDSLDDLVIFNADATVEDGVLRLGATHPTFIASADYILESTLSGEWTIKVRMGRETNRGTVRIYWISENASFPLFSILVGVFDSGPPEHNYRFQYLEAATDTWFYAPDLSGSSADVRIEPGEFTEFTFGLDGGEFYMQAGDTEIHRINPRAEFAASWETMTEIWLAGWAPDNIGSAYLYDWVEVTGEPIGGGRSRRGVDLEKAIGDGSVAERGERAGRPPGGNR